MISRKWVLVDICVNAVLIVITLYMAQNMWVTLPIIAIIVWNFIDGVTRKIPASFGRQVFDGLLNASLVTSIFIMTNNGWILIPVFGLLIWNYIDGAVRSRT